MNTSHINRQIVFHALIVVIFLSIPILTSPDFDLTFNLFRVTGFQRSFLVYVLILLFFYIHSFILLRNFYLTKKYLWYALSLLIGFAVIVSIDYFMMKDGISGRPAPPDFPKELMHKPFRGQNLLTTMIPFSLVTLLSHVMYLNKKNQEIELDKYQSELKNLKYQLQPHFLFNSLNNIYSISITQPEKTPYYIQELAEVMRYMLQSDSIEKVLLKDDLHFCEQYISLQRLRFPQFEKDWKIHFDKVDTTLTIPSFLLIPLIENVFKYGISTDKESPILIQVKQENRTVIFTTENKKNNMKESKLLSSQKLGLAKTRERLTLLYPNRYELVVSETEDTFSLNLSIQL